LDYSPSFYAPNTMQIPDGRRLTWGWVKDFPTGHGWNGCLSLPRQLSLSRDGDLRQSPAPQLAKLRGRGMKWGDIRLESGAQSFPMPKTNTLEILMTVDLRTAKSFHLKIGDNTKDSSPVGVDFDGLELQVLDSKAPLKLEPGEKLKLNIFMDRSVLEVFANDRVCFTKVIAPLDASLQLTAGAAGGAAEVQRLQAWPMKSIW
jgi:beta-fructofuranosidase